MSTSYAEYSDVVARAGRARVMFGQNNAPDQAEIERFLVDTSAIVDAKLAAAGVPLPITNGTAISALSPITADGALVLALEGIIDSAAAEQALGGIRDAAQARWLAALAEIEKGTSPVIAILVESGGGAGGAGDFWSDNPQYDYVRAPQEGLTQSPSIRPVLRRGMTL